MVNRESRAVLPSGFFFLASVPKTAMLQITVLGAQMSDTPGMSTKRVVFRSLASGLAVVLLASAMVGCEGVPRDTTATPPPPRESFTRADEVYPAPSQGRQQPAARAP